MVYKVELYNFNKCSCGASTMVSEHTKSYIVNYQLCCSLHHDICLGSSSVILLHYLWSMPKKAIKYLLFMDSEGIFVVVWMLVMRTAWTVNLANLTLAVHYTFSWVFLSLCAQFTVVCNWRNANLQQFLE